MTYVLCEVETCRHHDGDSCTLETVEVSTRLSVKEWRDGKHNEKPRCMDFEGWKETDNDE